MGGFCGGRAEFWRRRNPGRSRYCQLEEDGGGVRGFVGFVEIMRLPSGGDARSQDQKGRGNQLMQKIGLCVGDTGCAQFFSAL